MKQHAEKSQAEEIYKENFRKHVSRDMWMGVIFSIDDAGELHMYRTTWKFPTDRMLDVIPKLTKNLIEAIRSVPVVEENPTEEELPLADFLELQNKLLAKEGAVLQEVAAADEIDYPSAIPCGIKILPLDKEKVEDESGVETLPLSQLYKEKESV